MRRLSFFFSFSILFIYNLHRFFFCFCSVWDVKINTSNESFSCGEIIGVFFPSSFCSTRKKNKHMCERPQVTHHSLKMWNSVSSRRVSIVFKVASHFSYCAACSVATTWTDFFRWTLYTRSGISQSVCDVKPDDSVHRLFIFSARRSECRQNLILIVNHSKSDIIFHEFSSCFFFFVEKFIFFNVLITLENQFSVILQILYICAIESS